MIPSFIILFREVLEISIILSIVLAATRGVCGRNKFILLGVSGGCLGAVMIALFAGAISDALDGMGQEVFNGVVLLLAAGMIGWTTVWMQTHGRELAQKIKQVGVCVREGSLPLYSVAVVVALSMWREGAEIVLFMAGISSVTTDSMFAVAAGAAGGGLLAAAIGGLIYMGLITLSSRHLFRVTGWLLILLAAGMSAAGAGYLAAADVLPVLATQLWDSSALLSDDSVMGKILHAMLGYSARPSGIQLAFYLGTLGVILLMLRLRDGGGMRKYRLQTVAIGLAAIAVFFAAHSAQAAFTVYSPRVEQGMLEVENKNRLRL